MNTPAVSIIIPNHNRGDLLMQTIASVQSQTNSDFECVIVDDHSTDDPVARLKPVLDLDPRFRLIHVPDGRRGAQAARNIGIEASRGELVMLLDSDDLITPDCIEQRIAAMQNNPKLDFAVFPCECFRKTPGDDGCYWNIKTADDDLWRFLKGDVPWQTTSPIWRRESLLKMLPWPETVPVAQDWEFHIRALVKKLKYERFGTTDHYWRRAEAERESIGKNSFKPELLRGRVSVNELVLKTVRDSGLLNDAYREAFAGLFWQSAERIGVRVSRKEGRDVWQKALDLGLITPKQFRQGKLFFILSRFEKLRPKLLASLQKKWPASFFITRSKTYLKAPVPTSNPN